MNSKLGVELVGITMTAVIIVLALLPIYSAAGGDYPFYKLNVLVIVIAVTWCRYIFLLKHHWVSIHKAIKAFFILIPIPVFIFLIDVIYEFQAFADNKGFDSVLTGLSYKYQSGLVTYIKTEMILVWTIAFLGNLFMPIRMLLSIWREINKGTH